MSGDCAAVSFATGDNPYVTERARRELQWMPHLGSREALARTVRWFLDRKTKGPGKPGPVYYGR